MSNYRDAQSTVLTAMGWTYNRFLDLWQKGEASFVQQRIDANWCFGVLVPWLWAEKRIRLYPQYAGAWDCRWALPGGSEDGRWEGASTVEEAMIRAAAQALT